MTTEARSGSSARSSGADRVGDINDELRDDSLLAVGCDDLTGGA